MTPRLRLAEPAFGADVESLVLAVLRSGHLAQGPMVEALETAVATLVGVPHAIAVCNGTAALIAALDAIGIGRGDEVVTSPFTFAATANAILAVGGTVRFADVSITDGTLDPRSVEALIGPRTAAILPVHLFGHPADMSSITALATRHGLAVVEDAAQAIGATHAGRQVGSFGTGTFSMYATKNITTGEGGIVTTEDPTVAAAIRRFRNQGSVRPYEYESFGVNFRMTDVHAAIGLPQVEQIDRIIATRVANAKRLTAGLDDLDGIVCPFVRPGDTHVFHQYTVRVTDRARLDRATLAKCLAERGVATAVYYPSLLHDHAHFSESSRVRLDPCPTASLLTREVLSLPVHPRLTAGELDEIADAVREVMA